MRSNEETDQINDVRSASSEAEVSVGWGGGVGGRRGAKGDCIFSVFTNWVFLKLLIFQRVCVFFFCFVFVFVFVFFSNGCTLFSNVLE